MYENWKKYFISLMSEEEIWEKKFLTSDDLKKHSGCVQWWYNDTFYTTQLYDDLYSYTMTLPWCSKGIQRILCYCYCACLKKTWQEWNNVGVFHYKSQDQVHFSTDKTDKVILFLATALIQSIWIAKICKLSCILALEKEPSQLVNAKC